MGGCAGEGYRNVLAQEAKQARNEALVKKAFEDLDAFKIPEVLAAIRKNRGLVNQTYGEHGATLLAAAIYKMGSKGNSLSSEQFLALKKFINELIVNHKDLRVDLTLQNSVGSTPLHSIFWAAINEINEKTHEHFIELGVAVLKALGDASTFRKMLGIQNNKWPRESFMHHIYPDKDAEYVNWTAVIILQSSIEALLEKYKRKPGSKTQFNFQAKSFGEYLDECLLDGVMFEPLTEPYMNPATGTSLNQSTWKQLGKNEDPFTKTPFKEEELIAHPLLKQLRAIYEQFKDKPAAELFKAIKGALPEQKQDDKVNQFKIDIKLEELYELVAAFEAQLRLEAKAPDKSNDAKVSPPAKAPQEIKITEKQLRAQRALKSLVEDTLGEVTTACSRSGLEFVMDPRYPILGAIYDWIESQQKGALAAEKINYVINLIIGVSKLEIPPGPFAATLISTKDLKDFVGTIVRDQQQYYEQPLKTIEIGMPTLVKLDSKEAVNALIEQQFGPGLSGAFTPGKA